jgi:putative transposase
VTEKDMKLSMAALKPVYQALTSEKGYENLIALDEKWVKKYPVSHQCYYTNWECLSTFFRFDAHVRKVLYMANKVEGFH